jgi:hypothetical protein
MIIPERLGLRQNRASGFAARSDCALEGQTKYFWTFRARYKITGQSQVTRWAFSSIPSTATSDYPVQRVGGNCDVDAIPSTNYFRFITPDT